MKNDKVKLKFLLIAVFTFLFLIFNASSVFAASLIPPSLVPCGRCAQFGTDSNRHTICIQPSEGATAAEAQPCTVCHFFVLIQNIINFILYVFASLTTLMAIYIAFLFMFSGGSPAKITDAKGKLWLVIIGIFWVLGSWLVLNTIINFITVIGEPGPFPMPWNQINCSVSQPSSSSSVPLVLSPIIIGQAALTTDFGNGSERIFEGNIVEGETLLDALNQASKAGNFSYQLDEENNLAAIGSFTRNKNKSWHWYLNDKKIDKPLGKIILKSGDEILLQYK